MKTSNLFPSFYNCWWETTAGCIFTARTWNSTSMSLQACSTAHFLISSHRAKGALSKDTMWRSELGLHGKPAVSSNSPGLLKSVLCFLGTQQLRNQQHIKRSPRSLHNLVCVLACPKAKQLTCFYLHRFAGWVNQPHLVAVGDCNGGLSSTTKDRTKRALWNFLIDHLPIQYLEKASLALHLSTLNP